MDTVPAWLVYLFMWTPVFFVGGVVGHLIWRRRNRQRDGGTRSSPEPTEEEARADRTETR